MKTIPNIRSFSLEELCCLLHTCYETLEWAYQESSDKSLWQLAIETKFASDFLKCEIDTQRKNHSIH